MLIGGVFGFLKLYCFLEISSLTIELIKVEHFFEILSISSHIN